MPDKAALDMLVPTKAVPLISSDGSKPDVAFLQTPEQRAEIAKANEAEKPGKDSGKPEKAVPEVKADEPKVEAKKADDVEGDEPEKKDETPPWMKRELTKARNRERDAKAAAVETQARLDKALSALEAAGKKPTTEQTGEDDPRPIRSKYDNPDQYEADFISWNRRDTARMIRAENEARELKSTKAKQEKDRADYIKDLQKDWTEARDEFVAEHPDYEEVAEAEDLTISTALGAALITTRKDGPKLAYWLGQNRDEAARLSKLDQASAAYELGRISDRLNAKPAQEKRAANPLKPLSGVRSGSNTARPYDMEARLAEVRQRNKPFMPAPTGRPN